MSKNQHPNELATYRIRMRLSQEQVAQLIGHKRTNYISRLELGRYLPSLPLALKLAALYRVPVDFLYPRLYSSFRDELRRREEALWEQKPAGQLTLKLQTDVA